MQSETGYILLYVPQTSAAGLGLGSGRGCWTRGGVWGSPCRLYRPPPSLHRLLLLSRPLTDRQSGRTHLSAGTKGRDVWDEMLEIFLNCHCLQCDSFGSTKTISLFNQFLDSSSVFILKMAGNCASCWQIFLQSDDRLWYFTHLYIIHKYIKSHVALNNQIYVTWLYRRMKY